MNHPIRLRGALAALALAAPALLAGPAAAADIEVIHREAEVAVPPEKAWAAVGDYCAITKWLQPPIMSCRLAAGSGDVGTVRHLELGADRVLLVEPMVAAGAMHYTYSMTEGVFAGIQYHGTVAVRPGSSTGRSIVSWTGVFDREALPDMAAADETAATINGIYDAGIRGLAALAGM